MVEGAQVVGVGDREESGGDGLPAELVQVQGDGVGGLQSREPGAVPLAEQEARAVGGVDVEAGAVGGAAVGDLGQRVDEPGVGGARGGGDEVRAGDLGEGLVQGGGVEGAGGGGDDDGLGQAEQPGGAGQRVVGARPVDQPQARAVPLAGEQDGELVGLGASGGDDGVGGAGLPGQGAGDEGFQRGGGGCLVPGVEGG